MMLVASRFGGAGLGRRVLAHVLELADPAVVYLAATSYSRALCEDLGFRAIDTVDRHAGQFVPERRAEPLSRVRPMANCDLSYRWSRPPRRASAGQSEWTYADVMPNWRAGLSAAD